MRQCPIFTTPEAKLAELIRKGRCLCCASKSHKTEDCRRRETENCAVCSEARRPVNHSRRMCVYISDQLREIGEKPIGPSPIKVEGKADKPVPKSNRPRGKPRCLFCNQAHLSEACNMHKSVEKRRARAVIKGRCFRCLRRGHTTKGCQTKMFPCFYCNGEHHIFLCEVNTKSTSGNDKLLAPSLIKAEGKSKSLYKSTAALEAMEELPFPRTPLEFITFQEQVEEMLCDFEQQGFDVNIDFVLQTLRRHLKCFWTELKAQWKAGDA